jgi:hypothetical protein
VGVGLLVFWAIPGGGVTAWVVTGCCLVCASFVLFEARAGWCALRAMRIKTPL